MAEPEHPRIRDPENGQYVSLSTLFERERLEHSKDHDREQSIAKDTAQRLERAVNDAAIRLERAVGTALDAFSETARVHADAHAKEHIAHERIHQVEKVQVDKAEQSMNKRLEGMNEFRAALQDQASKAVNRDYYDARHEELKEKVINLEKSGVSREAVEAYKRIVYGTFVTVLVALGIALFNLVTK